MNSPLRDDVVKILIGTNFQPRTPDLAWPQTLPGWLPKSARIGLLAILGNESCPPSALATCVPRQHCRTLPRFHITRGRSFTQMGRWQYL